MHFEGITRAAEGGIANVVINRPKVRNAVRPQTYEELTRAVSGIGAFLEKRKPDFRQYRAKR
jgi:1,4-dihydroxy-2-naphthoyl-CoA synthase